MAMKQTDNTKSVLFVICLAASLVPFMSSALNLALPDINRELSIKANLSGWIPASYMLSTAIFQIPCARIADIVGRRKIFIAGLVLFFIFSVLSGLAYTGEALIIYRFLAGIGSAMMFGTSMAILTAAVPPEKRGWALGINTSVVYFSLAAGPFFGGFLTEKLGWHSIFFVSAVISLLALIGSLLLLKEDWKEKTKQKFDLTGSVMYAVGLSALIYGFSQLPHLYAVGLIAGGIIVLFIFSVYEKKKDQPVFNVKLFSVNRIFRLSSLSALINYSATFAISFMLSLYLQYVRELSPIEAGFILIVQSVIQSLVSLMAGRMSDKVSPSILATSGMFIIALGLIGLCFIDEHTSFLLIGGLLFMLGMGFGIFSSPNMNVIMSSVEPRYYGLASATAGTMRLTGQAFSMGIAIMAISIYIGNVEITHEVHHGLMKSLRLTFIICSVLCFIGVYTSSVRNHKNKQ